jgi:hypothetical protein
MILVFLRVQYVISHSYLRVTPEIFRLFLGVAYLWVISGISLGYL